MDNQNTLGLNIFNGNFSDFIENSTLKSSSYACFLNSHMLHEFNKNKRFQEVLKNATYILPDGMPITYAVRIFRENNQERIAGNDVIFSLVDKASEDNLKIFVIGTSEEILKKISVKLRKKYITHKTYSPPFKPIEEFDFKYQSNLINDFDPDLIFVGLGCPKQETWMHNMKGTINAPMFGLGGALLLYAGVDSRAPIWMRKLALEWLFRLALEPKRLFRRYLITNTYFCFLFVKELMKKISK